MDGTLPFPNVDTGTQLRSEAHVVIGRSLPRDVDMGEGHGDPEAKQLPRALTKDRGQSPKSERGKECVAGRCRMR